MQRKYEFTGEEMQVGGTTLRRIRAVRNFGLVSKEAIGGWIEREKNLSHDGLCWISGDARVFGNALVFGDALVCDGAQVHGEAQVSGRSWICRDAQVYGVARISGNAQICGNARIYGTANVSGDARIDGGTWGHSPLYVQGSRHPAHWVAPGILAIGCEERSLDSWLLNFEEVGEENDYSPEEIEEYRQIIELFVTMNSRT